MSNNIRIRTTPNGGDQYIKLKVEQDFDFIEILSLNISQDKAYENFCSDYGAIAGRVIINNGFGVPNAKVSVFIPISEEDKNNPKIKGLYPYETVNDVDDEGVRYNLLPKESDSQDDCYSIVGTLSAKREFLDNTDALEVYCKYYKFTTTTNHAGDFLIFGVPLGSHIVHVDVDISNIGIASQRPYDLIEQGTPSRMFYSPTKFKKSKNLNSLIQIKTLNAAVNVQPFWGDTDNCVIGINRLDLDLNYNIRPAAMFMGSIFGDSRKNSINKRCRPRRKLGSMCELVPREGTIEMLRKTTDGLVEKFDIEGGRLIDSSGAWAYQIPMNLDYMVTDENGELIPSDDPSKGIPTRARVRFRISMDEGGAIGRLRTRGKYIVPHNPKTQNDIDFTFDETVKDNSNTFRDMYWNKIYTVRNFISRAERDNLAFTKPYRIKAYTGIKNVDGCVGDKSPMPYNRTYVKGDILFAIICIIFWLIATIVSVINGFLCKLARLKIIKVRPFGWVRNFFIKLTCPDENETKFIPGAKKCGGSTVEEYLDCVKAVLADELNLFQFDFYNDWVNGGLYYYLLKYKKARKGREKFCETYCKDYTGGTGFNTCKTSKLRDTTYISRSDSKTQGFRNGLLVKKDGELYYPPMMINGKAFKLFPTDITNLGSVFECDWQGMPKIVQYLSNTSYKVPPLLAESYTEEDVNLPASEQYVVPGMFKGSSPAIGGIEGMFFNIDCLKGVDYNSRNARNLRRQSELSVDIVEYLASASSLSTQYVTINQIYDVSDPIETALSINRYVRDSFYLLNISGTSITSLPTPSTNLLSQAGGTSFGVNNTPNINGSAYTQFRGWKFPDSDPDMSFQTENSYYMYFGIVPGRTALDKLKTKFFTTCTPEISDNFIIDTSVVNTSVVGGSDGSITFTFVGGVGPFTYVWNGINVSYTFGPAIISSTPPTGIITGLTAGVYEITVTDSLGTTVVKDVTVDGPAGLSCSFFLDSQNTTATATDGEVQAATITGGVPPYTLTIYDINNSLYATYSNVITGQMFSGFISGTYTFTITDASGNTCSSQIDVSGPLTLGITNVLTNIDCGDCSGSFDFDVTGGTSPFTTQLLSGSTPFSADTTTGNYLDLCGGNYTFTVIDSAQPIPQTYSTIINIPLGPRATRTNTVLVSSGPPPIYDITFTITGGTSPYDVLYNNNQLTAISTTPYTYVVSTSATTAFTIEVTDTDGCYSEQTI